MGEFRALHRGELVLARYRTRGIDTALVATLVAPAEQVGSPVVVAYPDEGDDAVACVCDPLNATALAGWATQVEG